MEMNYDGIPNEQRDNSVKSVAHENENLFVDVVVDVIDDADSGTSGEC